MQADAAVFAEIDGIVAGRGFVDASTSTQIERLQAAAAPEAPLCLSIAEALRALPPSEDVLLFTGFVVPQRMPHGENDGPLGTVVLARALGRLGLRPEIWVDPQVLDTTAWLSAECGVNVSVRSIDAPPLKRRTPSAAIAIEKPARNRRGVMHTFDGVAFEGGSIGVDDLFDHWTNRGVLTIGIGDRGNEIGFGSIADVVRAVLPEAATCRCDCGGGVVAETLTQWLFPSAVSNWGAYGLAAALALLSGDVGCLVGPSEEARMLRISALRGCVDGVRRRGKFSVDAISGGVCLDVVRTLARVVTDALTDEEHKNACA